MDKSLHILKPYTDIILFVIALLAANFFWKFTVHGDEGGIQVIWLGMDITQPFDIKIGRASCRERVSVRV